MSLPPWTDGPRELLQHAADHLEAGGDFDRRIAMISVDNAVELAVKTFLGLPERARGSKGPGRRELESASESFPALLDLLQAHASQRLTGTSLDDIEWYHRLRNQLYHSGNGITVDRDKVDTYLELALTLFENLFGLSPALTRGASTRTDTGRFLELWIALERQLRAKLPPRSKGQLAYFWKREFLATVSAEVADAFDQLALFRNNLVHGLESPSPSAIQAHIALIRRVASELSVVLPP